MPNEAEPLPEGLASPIAIADELLDPKSVSGAGPVGSVPGSGLGANGVGVGEVGDGEGQGEGKGESGEAGGDGSSVSRVPFEIGVSVFRRADVRSSRKLLFQTCPSLIFGW